MSTASTLMTTEQLMALPDDGMERWLVNGELWEKPMTKRNRFHSWIESRIAQQLWNWVDQQSQPRGEVHSGEAGVRLRRDPDTTVGVDVVYISPELAAQQTAETSLIEGVPTLAVEILSPNDTLEQIHEKISLYQDCGVPLIWIVDPYDCTLRVYERDSEPVLFNTGQELCGDPHLPGLTMPVARIFPCSTPPFE